VLCSALDGRSVQFSQDGTRGSKADINFDIRQIPDFFRRQLPPALSGRHTANDSAAAPSIFKLAFSLLNL